VGRGGGRMESAEACVSTAACLHEAHVVTRTLLSHVPLSHTYPYRAFTLYILGL
jgi:hypothetical protein